MLAKSYMGVTYQSNWEYWTDHYLYQKSLPSRVAKTLRRNIDYVPWRLQSCRSTSSSFDLQCSRFKNYFTIMNDKRWLLIAPAFNCDGQAASQTLTDKFPYLEAAGIELCVIGGMSGRRHARIPHEQIWSWSPSGLRYEYRYVIRNRHGRGFRYKLQTIPISILLSPFILVERIITGLSSHWSWAPAAAFKAWRLSRKKSFDVIYSSGGPISAHLAGWLIYQCTGIPWIAEIHDPIVATARTQPTSPGGRWSRQKYLEHLLEKLVCRDARIAWWFTKAALDAARSRHPQLGERGFYVLPGVMPPEVLEQHVYGEGLNIGHFGKISGTRSLYEFLLGLNVWLERNPEARKVIQLHIYGGGIDDRAKQAADQLCLWSVIVCHGRLERDPVTRESGRTQVTRKMQQCDALLLLHGNDPGCAEYIPSKIYEYFWARRPILALTHMNPQLDELVERFGGITPKDKTPQGISDSLDVIWNKWKSKTLEPSDAPPIGVDVAVSTILQHIFSPDVAHRANL